MYDTLEARLTAAGLRTTKLQSAYSALRLASGDVTAAKAYTAGLRIRISACTWAKAIEAYRLVH